MKAGMALGRSLSSIVISLMPGDDPLTLVTEVHSFRHFVSLTLKQGMWMAHFAMYFLLFTLAMLLIPGFDAWWQNGSTAVTPKEGAEIISLPMAEQAVS